MRLSDLLQPDRLLVPLRGTTKEGVLRELVQVLVGGNGSTTEEVLGAILERERQFPTGIGYGVAVPHGRSPALGGFRAAAGTARAPIPYESVDGEPVQLFFLLAGPEATAGDHVKVIGRISRLVRREAVRRQLLAAATPEEFHRALSEAEVG